MVDWAHSCHICAETGLTPATSAPGLGSPLPHLRRDLAHPCHICAGTGLTPATSAPGLGAPRATLPQPGAEKPRPQPAQEEEPSAARAALWHSRGRARPRAAGAELARAPRGGRAAQRLSVALPRRRDGLAIASVRRRGAVGHGELAGDGGGRVLAARDARVEEQIRLLLENGAKRHLLHLRRRVVLPCRRLRHGRHARHNGWCRSPGVSPFAVQLWQRCRARVPSRHPSRTRRRWSS